MAEVKAHNPDSDFSEEDLSAADVAFNAASNHVRTITGKLNANQLLELYGLYKQGLEGKCDTSKPSWFSMQARQKWEAWQTLGDMSQDLAKEKYTQLVKKYDPEWTDKTSSTKGKSKETWVTVSTLRHSPEPVLDSNELHILEAARDNCADRVTELLSKNPELRLERDEDGMTALHWAADRDACEALNAAIKGGCPVNAVDDSGQTALHYASSCGNAKSVQILLDAGADPLLEDSEKSTALDLASDNEIKELLNSM